MDDQTNWIRIRGGIVCDRWSKEFCFQFMKQLRAEHGEEYDAKFWRKCVKNTSKATGIKFVEIKATEEEIKAKGVKF
jgi:hypothetical protein